MRVYLFILIFCTLNVLLSFNEFTDNRSISIIINNTNTNSNSNDNANKDNIIIDQKKNYLSEESKHKINFYHLGLGF